MSSLVRIDRQADLNDPRGRELLHETLELMAAKLSRASQELESVRKQERLVRPVPVEAYPVATGQIYTGAEVPRNVGDIYWVAYPSSGGIPAGSLECNGAAVSRTTYSDLFDKLNTSGLPFGSGDGSTTFNLPDLRRRSIVGAGGTQSTGPANTVGSTGGHEETEQHNHAHSAGHTHQGAANTVAGGGALTRLLATPVATAANDINVPNAVNATSAHNSDNYGNASSDGNYHPALVLTACIAFQTGPSDKIQTAPLSWGRINAQWRLDTSTNFPATAVENDHVSITDPFTGQTLAESVVKVTATSGTKGSSVTANKIVGTVRLPYNFTAFKPDGFRVRTRINATNCGATSGVSGGNTSKITLKISDPRSAGSYLSTQPSRTITADDGTGDDIVESGFTQLGITAEELGKDWRPNYAFRFEIVWEVHGTFSTMDLEVGLLEWLVK